MENEKIVATIEVTTGGYLDIDGQQYRLEQLSEFRDLYKVTEFKFRVIPWCWRVSSTQLKNSKRVLEAFGYEII